MNRESIAAAAIALVVGLWGGVMLSGLSAGGPPLPFVGARGEQIRPVNAPRQAPTAADGMAFAGVRIDTSTEQPKACLEFTEPLSGDPNVRFADYLSIEPRIPAQIEATGKELCITGLPYEPDRFVTIKKGLPSATGDSTDQDETFTLTFGQRPAYVGFVGSGMILPRSEADGLAIETVNVSKISVEVLRVPDRVLSQQSLDLGGLVSAGSWDGYEMDGAGGDTGATIYEGTLDVAIGAGASERRNQPITTVFPLGAMLKDRRPGGYIVKVRDVSPGVDGAGSGEDDDGDARAAGAYRLILYTDVALQSFEGAGGLDLIARSLTSAQPLTGVTVTLIAQNNEELARARSDGQGRVRFERALLDGEGGAKARFVMAYGANGDFTGLDLQRAPVDLSDQDVAGRTPPGEADGYLWTERGVYRPGEVVRLQGLIRDSLGRAVADRPSTLKIYRPNGTEFRSLRLQPAVMAGAVAQNIGIDRGAPRGQWRATLAVDGQEALAGEVSFSVEDFVPQRLKVEVEGAPDRQPLRAGETRAVGVNAQFLYGAPGAGLSVEAEGRLQIDPSPFDDAALEGFSFGKPDESFSERRLTFPGTTTDGAGRAEVAVSLADAPATSLPLRLRVAVNVLDPGGRAVGEGFSVPVRLSNRYFGIRQTAEGARFAEGAEARFEIVAVDANGARIAANDVSWTLVEEDWSYDWYSENGRWKWRRSGRDIPRDAGTLQVGAGAFATLEKPGLRNGSYRLMLRGADGTESALRFGVGWGGPAEDDATPDAVEVSGPAEPVRVGQNVRLNVRAPYPGRAQVVVATDRVLSMQTVQVGAGGTNVSVRADASWGPGAYVMVTVMTPRDPADRPVPRRAVGVTYVPIDVSSRTLTVAIGEGLGQLRPNTRVEVPIKVTGAPRGERVRVSLAAVDEGILQLTKFESPDPAKFYFDRRALGVSLRDDYGRLLNPNLAAATVPRQGGDSLGGEGLTVVPTKTVALFTTVLELDRSGEATVPLDLPDFNGALRLMVVAWTETAMGAGAEQVRVRDPVVAELSLPRFLAPGDRALAALSIDNVEGPVGAYTVRFGAEGGPQLDPAPQRLQLARGARRTLQAPVAAGAPGIGKVSFTLEGPEGFSVTRSYDIQTRAAALPITTTQTVRMNPGDAFTLTPQVYGALLPGQGQATVSFSNLPGLDPGPLLDSLERYPYGCTEQLVSVATPLLYARVLGEAQGQPLTPEELGRYRARVQDAIGRVLDRQGPDGAFGLWRADDGAATVWIGAYTVDFLRRAKAEGYAVPDDALALAYRSLRGIARIDDTVSASYLSEVQAWPGNGDTSALLRSRAAAYALYVLAKAGEVDIGQVRYFHDSRLRGEPSPLARAHIAAALAHLGDNARAANAFRLAEEALGYRNTGDWYQTPVRDLAGVMALAGEAGRGEVIDRLSPMLARQQPDPARLMTQEQTQLVMAAFAVSGGAGRVQVSRDGAAGAAARPQTFFAGQTPQGVGFRNDGDRPVWRTVTVSGAPRDIPGPASEGFSVSKQLLALEGGGVDPAGLRQGQRLIIALSGAPQAARTHPTIMVDLLPAGFEIEQVLTPGDGLLPADYDGGSRSGPFSFVGRISSPRIAEARDDRFVAAMDLTGQSFQLAYIVRAVTPGSYVLPGLVVEDMYRPSFVGRTAAGRVEIAPQAP